MLFLSRDQFWTNNLQPQKHDTKGNSTGWQISPLPQISFLLEDQIGSIWGCLCCSSSIRRRRGCPGSSNMPFLCFYFLVLSARHQICIFHFVTLFQIADRFFSPGCDSPPCVEEEVHNTKPNLASISGFLLIAQLCALWGTRVINQGPSPPFSSPKFALAFVTFEACPVEIWIHFGSKRGLHCTTTGALCSSSCMMMMFS